MRAIKFLFFLILVCVSSIINAQIVPFPNTQQFGTPITLTTFNGGAKAGIGFINAVYTDTTAANANPYIKYYIGAQIFTSSDSKFWVRSATRWIEVGGTAGLGTVTSVAISMPSAFNVSGSPITNAGTFTITGAGTTNQYIRGDGSLGTSILQFNPSVGLWLSQTGTYPNITTLFDSSGAAQYFVRKKDSVAGGYYPYSTNPKGYLTSADISGKLNISDTLNMLNPYLRTAGDLSPLFTTTESSHNIVYNLTNSTAYTLFGRGSGTGAPSYLPSIDSNWVTGLHSENYYNTKYLQNITGLISAGTNVTITGSGTSGSPYVINSSGGGTTLTVGLLDSLTKSSNGAVIAGSKLVMQTADATHPGLMTAAQYDSLSRSSYLNLVAGPAGFYPVSKAINDSVLNIKALKFTVNGGAAITPTQTDSTAWFDIVVAATGSTNSNIGSGFRLAVPNTNDIKTIFTGLGIGMDSTTNTNALTIINTLPSPWRVESDSSLNYYTAGVSIGGAANGFLVANPLTAQVSGYYAINTGAANVSHNPDFSWINKINTTRIRQNGNVNTVKFYLAAVSGTDFYFDTWRYNVGSNTYDRINHINIFSLLSAGTNTITLPSACNVLIGDYTGFSYNGAGSGLTAVASIGNASYYSNTFVTTPFNWTSSGSSFAFYVPVICYMADAPQIVVAGNSLTAGATNGASGIEPSLLTMYIGPAWKLDSILSTVTVQGMGISGNTTAQIQARFQADVTDLNPRYVLIEGNVNSVAGGVSTVSIIADTRKMFDSSLAHGIRPIYLMTTPWTNGTNAQNAQIDTINFRLDSIIRLSPYYSYSIDARPNLGQFRVGGAAGNYWDIKTVYNLDGIHFNEAGYIEWATVIADSMTARAGNSPDINASLELINSNQYFLPNRATTTIRDNFSNVSEGALIYNRTTKKYQYYNGSSWLNMDSTGAAAASINNNTSLQLNANFNIDGKGASSQYLVTQTNYQGADPPNNSFEDATPSSSGYVVGAPTSWTSSNGIRIYPPSAYSAPSPVNGVLVYAIETPGFVQTTTYAPGAGTYQLSLWIALPSGSKSLSILVDGVTVYTSSSFTSSFVKYTSSAFTVAAGNHTLRIETTGSGVIFMDYIQTVSPAQRYIQKWVNASGVTAMELDSASNFRLPLVTGVSGTADSALIRNASTGIVSMQKLPASTTRLDQLLAATGTNTINNVANAQEWQWNSLAGGTGLALTSTSTAAASNTQTLFKVDLSGANATSSQTTNAAQFYNSHTGTSSTNVAGYFSANQGSTNYAVYASSSSTSSTNVGGYFEANEGDLNYAIITGGGYVGLGTTTPNSDVQLINSLSVGISNTATSLTLNHVNHVVKVTATGQTITLPTAVGIDGRLYTIKLTASGSCTIATTSSQTIDGSTTYSLASQYKYVTVISDGANWIVIANN